ncbi:hypothetical protein BBOMB_0372 [Bifidobacterium bombi DSM 19703]|uniref:Uncharacterized protein n=1 Tax=Bifidobacterium bombi DSM 19703 TaxID=1341695 RepID=A0A080N2I6_9BIFI|nr:hypothetical protein BBOMB_0372 [Bifidobacterium bombi DSM 19703]
MRYDECPVAGRIENVKQQGIRILTEVVGPQGLEPWTDGL